eukprot:5424574-Prymnesium_polylepis.2
MSRARTSGRLGIPGEACLLRAYTTEGQHAHATTPPQPTPRLAHFRPLLRIAAGAQQQACTLNSAVLDSGALKLCSEATRVLHPARACSAIDARRGKSRSLKWPFIHTCTY